MKKLIVSIIVPFAFIASFGQSVTQRTPGTNTVNDPRQMHTLNLFPPVYADTTAANVQKGIDSTGAIIYTYDVKGYWFRQNSPKKWVRINSTNGNNGSDTLFAQLPAFFDSLTAAPNTILKILHDNGLLFGGTVTLDSCMSVDVQAGAIIINYNQINFAQTLGIVIPAADPSFGRVDAIIVDSSGRVFDSSGVESPTPVPVTINPSSQVLLTTINVPAGATCLPIIQGIIYDGISDFPAQWNTSTVGSISADFINTDNPFHLNQALFISTYTDGSGVIFTKPSGYDTAIAGAILRFSLYLNGLMSNQLRAVLLKDGVPVTNNLVLNPYFNPNDSNQYQIPSVPLSAWSFSNRTGAFNGIEFSFGGNDLSGSKGLYLDYIQIQTGFSPQTKSFADSTKIISGNEYYFINGIAYLAGPVGGGGGSSTLQIDFNNSVSAGDNPTIEMSGNDLIISQNGEQFLWLSPSALFSRLRATDGASANASIDVVADTASNTVQVQIRADKNTDVEGESQIILDGMASTIVMQSANGIILDDFLKLNTVPSGDISTDAVLTLNRSTGVVDTVSASSFGGSGTLQQATEASILAGDNPYINNHNGSFTIDSASFANFSYAGTTTGSLKNLAGSVSMTSDNSFFGIGAQVSVAASQILLDPREGGGTSGHLNIPNLDYSTASVLDILAIDTATNNIYRTRISAGGGGSTNSNIGSGFRLAVPGTNNIKTLFNKYGLVLDSSSNTNGISTAVDTSLLLTKLGAAALYTGNNGTVTSIGLTSSDITVGGTSSPITSSGTFTLTLPTVNSNVGTFTNSTVTVNAKGQVTAASSGTTLPNFAFNENHTGSTSTTITLAHNYITGTIRVFKNGARIQIPTDYVEATANTITLSSAPLTSDNLTVDFNY